MVDQEVLKLLMKSDWPGNVRQLYNVLEYAFAVSTGEVIGRKHLLAEVMGKLSSVPSPGTALNEKELILKTLEKTNYKKGKAAAFLGIHPTTLSRKLKKYGI